MTQAERAAALGISARQLRKLEGKGCPKDLEGARAWRARNVDPRPAGSMADERGAVTAGLEEALRTIARDAPPEAIRAAVLAFVRTLRERRLDEGAVGAHFSILCSSLGLPKK